MRFRPDGGTRANRQMSSENHTRSPDRMPSGTTAKRILHQRAQKLALGTDDVSDQESLSSYIRVSLGEYGLFDIPKSIANEVITSRGMAKVPCTPAHFAGVVSLRGEMIAVLDLPAFFGLGQLGCSDGQPILIVKGAGMTLGLLLDDVDSEIAYGSGQMGPAISGGGIEPRFVTGIHEGRFTVLDIEALMSDPDLILGA